MYKIILNFKNKLVLIKIKKVWKNDWHYFAMNSLTEKIPWERWISNKLFNFYFAPSRFFFHLFQFASREVCLQNCLNILQKSGKWLLSFSVSLLQILPC